ncbi:uncharacterized protein SPAPADRAFT_141277 [Spathaspora passalidarum NRRL Y-27907]|uniref:Uncharacterized protein n=1 Tax=Spathaspora passalidarum (strain NRRL Y-27907 / 11-Y1) TaxID=619300 RepID=G3AQ99_SPAPN|nr:uncharacterized protein SPAPADRAFT_141277 [Spathaspora passalidarum NRRL Y-27907]EGW31446.1 hypothetical protein SPAPADRAFT_141277 [Spathaspora passalidarum NRRL Y-27907]
MSRKGLVSLIVLCLCISALYESTTWPQLEKGGGAFEFLTLLSLAVTITYIILSQNASSNWNVKYIYPLASNLGFQVTMGYWSAKLLGVKSYERSLWLAIRLHAIPYLYLLILDSHPQGSATISVTITVAFMLAWCIYVDIIIYWNWGNNTTSVPYGTLNEKTFIERVVWIAGFTILSCSNYIILGIRNCL